MSLTLPIVVGKKYVCRNGSVAEAINLHAQYSDWIWCNDGKNRVASSGQYFPPQGESALDFVADYIEPAKRHPHSAHITKFAWDARETATPWDRWQTSNDEGRTWHAMDKMDGFNPDWMYRPKPVITPDPHAESMKLYAEDAAQTDKAWERWQGRLDRHDEWRDCTWHPAWVPREEYRRKPVA